MADWKGEEGEYDIAVPGQQNDTAVRLSQARDDTGEERRKILIEDHPENPGQSVLESPALEHVINSIWQGMVTETAQSMSLWERIFSRVKQEPDTVDWFVVDRKGTVGEKEPDRIYAVSLRYEEVTEHHPSYAELVRRNDEIQSELPEAKEAFPDRTWLKVVEASLSAIDAYQFQALSQAFTEAAQAHRLEVNPGERVETPQKPVAAAHRKDVGLDL